MAARPSVASGIVTRKPNSPAGGGARETRQIEQRTGPSSRAILAPTESIIQRHSDADGSCTTDDKEDQMTMLRSEQIDALVLALPGCKSRHRRALLPRV